MPQDDFERRFEQLKREADREVKRRASVARRAQRPPSSPWSNWAVRVIVILIAAALPFVTLVRTTLWADHALGFPPWPALILGIVTTAGLLVIYASMLAKRFTGRFRLPGFLVKTLLGVVGAYAAFALFTISATHLKSEGLRPYYRTLHPALRLAVVTATLTDDELLLTDLARQPADYERMGLARNDASQHFEQDDGYVHAIDIRTIGRAAWKNRFAALYFRAMGFTTLRHVGTADHLHVALRR